MVFLIVFILVGLFTATL